MIKDKSFVINNEEPRAIPCMGHYAVNLKNSAVKPLNNVNKEPVKFNNKLNEMHKVHKEC